MIKDLEQFFTDEMLDEHPRAYSDAFDFTLALKWVIENAKSTPLTTVESRAYGFAEGVRRRLAREKCV